MLTRPGAPVQGEVKCTREAARHKDFTCLTLPPHQVAGREVREFECLPFGARTLSGNLSFGRYSGRNCSQRCQSPDSCCVTLGQSAALSGFAQPFIYTMRELTSDFRGEGAPSDLLAGVSGFCGKRPTPGFVSPTRLLRAGHGSTQQVHTGQYLSNLDDQRENPLRILGCFSAPQARSHH